MHRLFASGLLAGTALIALAAPTYAAEAKKPTSSDPRIGVLEQQLRDVQQQLAEIKGAQGTNDYSAAVVDLKRSTSAQYERDGEGCALTESSQRRPQRLTGLFGRVIHVSR